MLTEILSFLLNKILLWICDAIRGPWGIISFIPSFTLHTTKLSIARLKKRKRIDLLLLSHTIFLQQLREEAWILLKYTNIQSSRMYNVQWKTFLWTELKSLRSKWSSELQLPHTSQIQNYLGKQKHLFMGRCVPTIVEDLRCYNRIQHPRWFWDQVWVQCSPAAKSCDCLLLTKETLSCMDYWNSVLLHKHFDFLVTK